MKFALPLSNILKGDVSSAGGKGASLGEMYNMNIPVPPGFVVLSSAFNLFLEKNKIDKEIKVILNSINYNEQKCIDFESKKIFDLIKSGVVPEEVKEEIFGYYNQTDSEFVAVRSSATMEDGSDLAWAGQLESYLNVSKDNLLDSVQSCWASLFTPRAILYRFNNGLLESEMSVAVVIQRMISSEKSGVVFTVHPVTENDKHIVIEAGFGLGEAIVSGLVTPDRYVVDKDSICVLQSEVSEHDRGLFAQKDGSHRWEELGNGYKEQVLTNEQITELSHLVMIIEKHYGFPCDIEWAFQNGNFYIIQCRPITTIKSKN